MGGGSTIAAAISVGYESIGIELNQRFFDTAVDAIPNLVKLNGNTKANSKRGTSYVGEKQRSLALITES
jgi:hypothetical protein